MLSKERSDWLVEKEYLRATRDLLADEKKALEAQIKEFEELNTVVIGASTDSQFSHLAWKNTPPKEGGPGEIKYPLLSDLGGRIAVPGRRPK